MVAKSKEQFSERETRERFVAALRGARVAGPQHKETVTPKQPMPQRKKRPKK